jgi:hypothetical protein
VGDSNSHSKNTPPNNLARTRCTKDALYLPCSGNLYTASFRASSKGNGRVRLPLPETAPHGTARTRIEPVPCSLPCRDGRCGPLATGESSFTALFGHLDQPSLLRISYCVADPHSASSRAYRSFLSWTARFLLLLLLMDKHTFCSVDVTESAIALTTAPWLRPAADAMRVRQRMYQLLPRQFKMGDQGIKLRTIYHRTSGDSTSYVKSALRRSWVPSSQPSSRRHARGPTQNRDCRRRYVLTECRLSFLSGLSSMAGIAGLAAGVMLREFADVTVRHASPSSLCSH